MSACGGTAREFGASTAQWDGSEFQPSMEGWGLPHSDQTFGSANNFQHEADYYWTGSTLQAFSESRALWKQPAAVELSLHVPGLGPWRGDMEPFADEQTLKTQGFCKGGDRWHRGMLKQIVEQGMMKRDPRSSVQ